MCMGSSPSVPATPEVQAAPQEQDAAVVDARAELREIFARLQA